MGRRGRSRQSEGSFNVSLVVNEKSCTKTFQITTEIRENPFNKAKHVEGGGVVKGKWEVWWGGGRVIVELGTLRFCLVLPWLIEYEYMAY